MAIYLTLLPYDLLKELFYFLPFSLIEIACNFNKKINNICNDRNFLNKYSLKHTTLSLLELESIAKTRQIPMTLLYDAPVALLKSLHNSESLTNTLDIVLQYDYLPIFKYITESTNIGFKTQYPHLSQAIYWLLRYKSNNAIKYLLDTYGGILPERAKYGILYRTVQDNNVSLLKYLIEDLHYDKISGIDNVLFFAVAPRQRESLIYLLTHVKFSQDVKNELLKLIRDPDTIELLKTINF